MIASMYWSIATAQRRRQECSSISTGSTRRAAEREIGGNAGGEECRTESSVARSGEDGAREQECGEDHEGDGDDRVAPNRVGSGETGAASQNEQGDAAHRIEEPRCKEAAGEKLFESTGEHERDGDDGLRHERGCGGSESRVDARRCTKEETLVGHRVVDARAGQDVAV